MYSTGKSWEIKLLLQFIHEHLEIVCVKYVENLIISWGNC